MGEGGSQGIKFSAQDAHSVLCVCAAQETERSSGVTLIQMTPFPELSLQPDQLPQVEREMLQDDPPPLRASLSIPERDPGPRGMEG